MPLRERAKGGIRPGWAFGLAAIKRKGQVYGAGECAEVAAAYFSELLLLFLAAISPGLCLRPGQVRKGGRERHGAGAVHKMAGLHLGLPDIY